MNNNILKEEETPNGLKVTLDNQKKSKAENDAYLKSVASKVDDVYSGIEEEEVENNKFNYEDGEKEYHDEMEILNGQEMIQYEREPSDRFKDKAEKALTGDSTMGNEIHTGEWDPETGEGNGNTEPVWGASDVKFGEKLLNRAKSSQKKRDAAELKWKALGDDMELSDKKDKTRSLSFEMVINDILPMVESKNYTHYAVLKENNKIIEAWDYSDVSSYDLRENPGTYFSHCLDSKINESIKKSDIIILNNKGINEREIDPNNKENWFTPIKENKLETTIQEKKMTRLNFKKLFNGMDNALKLVPESYKINGKKFQISDGIETYTIRWEGSLTEGASIVLNSENAQLIKEEKSRIHQLMDYDSRKEFGSPDKESRLVEDARLTLNLQRMKLQENKSPVSLVESTDNSIKDTTVEKIEESTDKFKAQRLDLGDYAKFINFKKANYIKEGDDKKITGVEYHLVLENNTLPKDALTRIIIETNKNKKPNGKKMKFSFYDSNGDNLTELGKTIE